MPRGKIGPFDVSVNNRGYYYGTLIVLAVVLILLGRLRRSGVGRTIIGVRENESAASALTVSPAKAKLTAYATGGFIAGLGGAILGGLVVTIGYTERFFTVEDSLSLVAMAVIGGLGGRAGAVIGALWVVGLPAFWPDNNLVPLLTSSIGLLIILLYIPGGFTQIGYWFRDEGLRFLEKRLPPQPAKASVEPPASLSRALPAGEVQTNTDGSVLRAVDLTVSYAGLVAVDDVSFRAMPGEVVGLIGTNGAGKSTLLNAIGGFVPSRGRIDLFGHDVSRLKPHRRARLGLGRTFQAATLFPDLTVREVVEVALEARGATSFWGTLLYVPKSARAERQRHVRRRRAGRLPRPGAIRRSLRRRAVHGDTPHRRAGGSPGRGSVGHLPRRAHRGCGPARDRSLRAAHQTGPDRAARHAGHRRARPAAHPGHQRPRILPRGRCGDRRGHADRGAVRPPGDRVLPGHRRAGHRPQQHRVRTVSVSLLCHSSLARGRCQRVTVCR